MAPGKTPTVYRKTLVEHIRAKLHARGTPVSRRTIERVLREFARVAAETIGHRDLLTLSEFGSFQVRFTRHKPGHWPPPGFHYVGPGKHGGCFRVIFKPSRLFHLYLNYRRDPKGQ